MLNSKFLKKGSSLIEVIIVLAIVSFTIIASMALVAKTRLEIKNNELADNANGVMLKALEALKTPTKVIIYGNVTLTGTGPYFFSVINPEETNSDGSRVLQDINAYVLEYKSPTQFTSLPKKSDTFNFTDVCRKGDAFYHTEGTFEYCQQVEISPITRTGSTSTKELYKVSTTIVYQTSSGAKSETLITYRYEGFKKIVPTP